MFLNVPALVARARLSTGRATQEPFFQQVAGDAPPSEDVSSIVPRCDDWLPTELQKLYSSVEEAVELHLDEHTILSYAEARERRDAKQKAGAAHGFADFMIQYVGMGHVRVWSADASGNVHVRIDGGSNGFDRLHNFEASLAPREPNAGTLADLDLAPPTGC